jgi:exodeoxyribonuclease III
MPTISITSWNVNSIRQRMEQVARLIVETAPDVLFLQETKVEDAAFPAAPIRELGYSLLASGQKAWNGVALISRLPLDEASEVLPNGYSTPSKRILSATAAGLRLVNVYVPNGGASPESFAQKLEFLDALVDVMSHCPKDVRLLLGGDFNVAPGEDDVYDPVTLDGSVCFHPEERARMQKLVESGAVDLFRRFTPTGRAYSWWDYRGLGFQRNLGMRLDHFMASPALAARAVSCAIDRGPRKWMKPSDHAPVTAVFDI